jgi:hypothetical protein
MKVLDERKRRQAPLMPVYESARQTLSARTDGKAQHTEYTDRMTMPGRSTNVD